MGAKEFISKRVSLATEILTAHPLTYPLKTMAEAKPPCLVGNGEFHGQPRWLESVPCSWEQLEKYAILDRCHLASWRKAVQQSVQIDEGEVMLKPGHTLSEWLVGSRAHL